MDMHSLECPIALIFDGMLRNQLEGGGCAYDLQANFKLPATSVTACLVITPVVNAAAPRGIPGRCISHRGRAEIDAAAGLTTPRQVPDMIGRTEIIFRTNWLGRKRCYVDF